jgi:hypothetical protein
VHQAHAATATTGAGLDHQWIADALGLAQQGRVVLLGALIASDARDAGVEHGDFRAAFAAHQFDGCDARADERQASLFAGAGELGVFREEAIARMDGVGTAAARGVDDRRDVQVGLLHGGGADVYGLIGDLHVQRVGVSVAVNGDGAVAQSLGGALDAAGDFTAVGDQDFLNGRHGLFPRKLRCMCWPHRWQASSHRFC